jgi:4'-phosphopantetheinyl transferase
MTLTTFTGFVRCSFYPEEYEVSDDIVAETEVFFGQTKDFNLDNSELPSHINKDDQLKTEKLRNIEDKKTVLICYTFLRMILSRKLNKNPQDIIYIEDINGKPGIKDNPIFFNISHTRDSFAIVISEQFNIGVDLEKVNRVMDIEAVIKRVFSREENEYILRSGGKAKNRFFLLWTRKEALLKAIGTGIISQLSHIEVFKPVNLINRDTIEGLANISFSSNYYIYSKKLGEYYLSVALPQKSEIILSRLNEKYAETYF